jgi:hypothetical protein
VKPKWTVSYSVYYSIEVEADSEQEATDKADGTEIDGWSRADSELKAEKNGE